MKKCFLVTITFSKPGSKEVLFESGNVIGTDMHAAIEGLFREIESEAGAGIQVRECLVKEVSFDFIKDAYNLLKSQSHD